MPTYDFVCPKCQHAFDMLLKMNYQEIIKCPKCDTPATQKISGGSGVIYKGTGFYSTDYKPVK